MRALLLIDLQNDFMPFGSLPVRDGEAAVAVANHLAPDFEFVVATQDWHPSDHGSFASNHMGRQPGQTIDLAGTEQVLWPDHCVQNMPGASFHSALDVAHIDAVIRKGTDPLVDSYSAFFDNARRCDTGLSAILADRGVQGVVIVGLATDYCVKYSALDARSLGFEVAVVADGVRAVDAVRGDGERALQAMASAGCTITSMAEVA